MNRREFLTVGAALCLKGCSSLDRTELSQAIYLDEMTPQGTARYKKFQAAHSRLGNDKPLIGVTFSHAPCDISEVERAMRSLEALNINIARNCALFAPNYVVTEAVHRWLSAKGGNSVLFFAIHNDPIRAGLCESYERPGGFATGFTYYYSAHLKLFEAARRVSHPNRQVGILVDRLLTEVSPFPSAMRTILQTHGFKATLVVIADSIAETISRTKNLVEMEVLTWVLPDAAELGDEDFAIVKSLARQNCRIVTNDRTLLKYGALLSIDPVVESPYDIWANQFALASSAFPVSQIPVERPLIFQRSLSIYQAQRLNVKFSNRELAAFDALT